MEVAAGVDGAMVNCLITWVNCSITLFSMNAGADIGGEFTTLESCSSKHPSLQLPLQARFRQDVIKSLLLDGPSVLCHLDPKSRRAPAQLWCHLDPLNGVLGL